MALVQLRKTKAGPVEMLNQPVELCYNSTWQAGNTRWTLRAAHIPNIGKRFYHVIEPLVLIEAAFAMHKTSYVKFESSFNTLIFQHSFGV